MGEGDDGGGKDKEKDLDLADNLDDDGDGLAYTLEYSKLEQLNNGVQELEKKC